MTFPVLTKLPVFSLTGKCLPIFPGIPVPLRTMGHSHWNRVDTHTLHFAQHCLTFTEWAVGEQPIYGYYTDRKG